MTRADPGHAHGSHLAMRGQLSLCGVTKAYREQRAVDELSLDVASGEFVTLLGPSGSGKTTTLAMIAGFARPDSGSIHLDGEDVTRVPPHRRDVGMVFQNYALFPHMTAAENVAFPLSTRKLPRQEIETRVAEALERVQLAGYAARYPRQLSGGQQQRVALARAFVFGPRLLLMDEPLGALDKKLREDLELQMVQLCRTLEMTAVYVTHDQEEALVMSDRIVIINHGRIEQAGTARALYERPSSRFVAEFLGESNVFEGVVEPAGSKYVLDATTVRIPVFATDERLRAPSALVIRPEHLRVLPARQLADASTDAQATLRGVVQEAIYLGSDIKLLVELEMGTTVRARVRPGSRGVPSPGDEVVVAWDVEAGVIVPASSDVPVLDEEAVKLDVASGAGLSR